MSFKIDPELAALREHLEARAPVPRGDIGALRNMSETSMKALATLLPTNEDISVQSVMLQVPENDEIELRFYTEGDERPGPAVVFAHGGGMVTGSLDSWDLIVKEYVAQSGIPFLAVGYRLAPEVTSSVPVEDVFAGLKWLVNNSRDLQVAPERIGVMGISAGGGLAAGVAILARDRNVPLARQVLLQPMLDDRTIISDPALDGLAVWTYDMNYTCWRALLGEASQTDDVSPVVAPARAKDLEGVCPAYIEVGELDIFRDESVAYASNLWRCGISAELRVYPGATHGYDLAQTSLARRSMHERLRALAEL